MINSVRMKVKQKQKSTFGDLITADYQDRGTCQAEMLMRVASHACLMVFRKPPAFFTSDTKGRSV